MNKYSGDYNWKGWTLKHMYTTAGSRHVAHQCFCTRIADFLNINTSEVQQYFNGEKANFTISEVMKITSKASYKAYQCTGCGQEKELQTNHWGDCYPFCNICKKVTVWRCEEEMPDGFQAPTPWKAVTLGDIAEII